MLPPTQERLFMILAEDHQPRSLEQLFCCIKDNLSHRVMYRRIRLLARDTEDSLRIAGSMWCIANSPGSSGFVMRKRVLTPDRMLATNVKATQKAKARKPKYRPRPKCDVRRVTWTARQPRIFLDPTKGVR